MSARFVRYRAVPVVLAMALIAMVFVAAGAPCIQMSLQEAVNDNNVTVVLTPKGGHFGDQVSIYIKNGRPECIEVIISKGTILVPTQSGEQEFVVTKETVVILGEGQEFETQGLYVFCLSQDKSTPTRRMHVGPDLAELPGESARQLAALLETIDSQGLHSEFDAQMAVWAITDAREVDPGSAVARILLSAGLEPARLADDFPDMASPPMLGESPIPPISLTFDLRTVLDPELLERVAAAGAGCADCVSYGPAGLPLGPIGPAFVDGGLSFVGTAFPPFVPTNLRIEDVCAPGAEDLWIGTGPLTVVFPQPVVCVEIVYCHYCGGQFSVHDEMGNLLATASLAVAQDMVHTSVLQASGIRFLRVDGAEIAIIRICYR